MRSDRQADPGRASGSDPVRDDDGGGSLSSRLTPRRIALVVAALVVLVDQLTKTWAVNTLSDGPIVVIDGVLQFRLTYNTGASFSLFSESGPLLAIVAIGVVGLIWWILGDASRRIEAIALGLVLGGSVGNLIDRLARGDAFLDGAVVDFIDVGVFTNNVADIALFVGVALLLIAAYVHRS